MRSLIVGGGQLGQSLCRALGEDASIVGGVSWSDPASARQRIDEAARRFIAESAGERWLACWSAGSGVVGTPESMLSIERVALQSMLTSLANAPGFDPRRGSVFVASSAGGIYGSGDGEMKNELSAPHPTSDYGRSKLAQDEAVIEWADAHGVRTLIGRISNLYGPRQDILKPQGFISHLCRAMALRTMFTLTVPVSTIRDFIYTDDVAERVRLWVSADGADVRHAQVKVIASGRSVTLGHVISITTAVSRTPARVLLASRPGPSEQPAALRFESVVLTDLDRDHPPRSLEDGIRATWQNAMLGLQASR